MDHIIKHDQESMKKNNSKLVLNLIRERRPISRAELAKLIDMSPTSVSRIVTDLLERGMIVETQLTSTGIGRKAILLDTVSDHRYTISLELDKTNYKVGIVDFDGHIRYKAEFNYESEVEEWMSVAKSICKSIRDITQSHGIDMGKVIGIGIGIPGIIDTANGFVGFSPQLGWKNVKFKDHIEKCIGLKTTIDNVIKLKALAENIHGSMKGSERAALVNFGSGVGSALVVNQEIYRGATNSAGEIGHTTVDPSGRMCDCGRRGCLQTYITEWALIQEANTYTKVSSIGEIFSFAVKGENWAVRIVEQMNTYISIAICDVINMYNPDTIIVGGKILEEAPEMLQAITSLVDKNVWEPFKGTYVLKTSNLGNNAGILGAATLVLDQYIDSL